MKRIALLVFFITVSVLIVRAEDNKGPSSGPILQLNTGMHTADVRSISADRDLKYIFTASGDKTAILWDFNTGEKLKTFRPPIDSGNEGLLYSCSLSPDGKTAAVGGWTGWLWSENDSVYVFDIKTGEIIKRVSGLTNTITDMEYSPDGRFLAVSINSDGGISIYNTNDWSRKVVLPGYGRGSKNMDFSRSGKLAAVSWDNKIRIFDPDFRLLKEVTGSGGKRPYSIAFSPDEKRLAVGYSDSSKIQILDTTTLGLLSTLEFTGTYGATIYTVAWSTDNKYVYVGGHNLIYVNNEWRSVIRRYAMNAPDSNSKRSPDNKNQSNDKNYTDIPSSMATVFYIKPLSDGSILFSGGYPDFGRIDSAGQSVLYKKGNINSMNKKDTSHLKLSDDGLSVGFTGMGQSAVTFSLKNRELSVKAAEFPSPNISGESIKITDWDLNPSPKLNGEAIMFFESGERCLSVDVSTDETAVLLGADYNVYCVEPNGKKRWNTVSPAAWAVNISGNGKLGVAALNDGTIRWYRMSDGTELLKLFAHSDLKRWVSWTASGYYDASVGGQDLIGWHLNNGSDRSSDFYPISRFEQRYYRPDVVALILDTLDETQALSQADKNRGKKDTNVQIAGILPPVVRIVSPQQGAQFDKPKVTLELFVKTLEDSPVEEIKILVNGRPTNNSVRGLSIVGKKSEGVNQSVSVDLVDGENRISVLAKNKNGYSDPDNVTITYNSQTTVKATEEFVLKPKLYVLSIGISAYKNPEIKLEYPAKDAKDFAAVMQRQKGGLYKDVIVKMLIDSDATKDNILDGLQWLQKETTSFDVAMLYISGHGMNDNGGRLYYLPYETDPDNLKRTALPAEEISYTLQGITGKAIYFMDTCHSGNMKVARRGSDPDMNAVINELSSAENGTVVYSSSSGKQYSLESKEWGNGAFTKSLIDGISGKADYTADGKITVNELGLYVAESVKVLTKGAQTPVLGKPDMMRDFAIAVKVK